MTKSYVTLEQHVCLVCTKTFDTGALLLDKRLRETFDHYTVTDWGLCPECEPKSKEYIALVVIDPTKSKQGPDQTVRPQDAYRTGEIIHLRRTVFPQIFNGHVLHDHQPMIFIDTEVAARLKAIPVADVPG